MRKILLVFLLFSSSCISFGQKALVDGIAKGVLENNLKRELYAAARQSVIPAELEKTIIYSLVQVHRPGNESVLGTAWIAKQNDEYFAVMPYHIGGAKGSKRELTLYTRYKQLKKILVTIEANGNAGYHSPDVSLARLEAEDVKDNIPLEISAPDFTQPSYSFGYTVGNFSPKDFFSMQRMFLNHEGMGITTDRIIPLEQRGKPWNLSGYCGSPLLQKINGQWKVVAMHAGSVVSSDLDFSKNRAFAISMEKAMNLLLSQMNQQNPSLRPLSFQGEEVTLLEQNETVRTVKIERDNTIIFTQEMRFFPYPYSDKHAEKAFIKAPLLQMGDLLHFYIHNDKHQIREVTFYVW